MDFSTAEYYIWLSRCYGEGRPAAGALLEHYGSARAIWNQRHALDKILSKYRMDTGRSNLFSLDQAAVTAAKSAAANIEILTPESPQWPRRLSAIPNPPVILYVRGDIDLLGRIDELPALSVVGTRTMTPYGAQAAELFAMGLASAGAVVISGMAAGIDTMAHKGALKSEGQTIAVLGCGLDHCYPAGNEELMEIISYHGAVISEYPIGTAPFGAHFPVRNRIISGLSVGVLVIEAKLKSGSLITANLAAEQGRDVFVLMTDYSRRGAKSLSKLIEDGAKPVARASDIINEYQARYPKTLKPQLADIPLQALDENILPVYEILPAKSRKAAKKITGKKQVSKPAQMAVPPDSSEEPPVLQIPDTLSEEAKRVLDCLHDLNQKHVDQIAAETGLPSSRLLAAVTELEMEGLVKNMPGRHYLKQIVG